MAPRTQGDTVLDIKFFDLNKIKKDSIVVLIGKRRTGKSYIIKSLLYFHRELSIGTVISPTDGILNYYSKFIPSMLIFPEYTPKLLERIFARQQLALTKGWANPHAFLLMDDCLSDAKTWSKDRKIIDIFNNGRHYKLLYILAMQSPMAIPPAFRTNIDFTFILKNNNHSDRKKIYENYAGMFKSFEEFEIVLDNCTEDFNCLVIDNSTTSNKLQDQVFYFKANPVSDDFKMCSNQMWHINNTQFNDLNRKSNDNSTVVHSKKGDKRYIINKKKH